jgi:hypothetical protein
MCLLSDLEVMGRMNSSGLSSARSLLTLFVFLSSGPCLVVMLVRGYIFVVGSV